MNILILQQFCNRAGEGSFEFVVNSNEYGNFFSVAPWIRLIFPELSAFKQCRHGSMVMVEIMKSLIDRQFATYQEGHVRNFLDLYIKEIKAAEGKGGKSDFTYDQLVMICTDFLLPSLAASEAQLGYLFGTLIHHPNVVKKIQEEIENVVGSGRFPELDDRIK